MHKIFINAIGKKDDKCYEALVQELVKNSKKYATIKIQNFFNKKINQAQKQQAKEIYSQILIPHMQESGINIALDPNGELIDSFAFAKIFKKHSVIAFFIGGAYGFEREFIQKCDMSLSLSPLTMSHKIAKVVLVEQIFRALSIVHNHPYHK